MTIKELIEKLSIYDENLQIFIEDNKGDYVEVHIEQAVARRYRPEGIKENEEFVILY